MSRPRFERADPDGVDARPRQLSRRGFLSAAGGLGSTALWTMLAPHNAHATDAPVARGRRSLPHFTPRARRVIYLFQSGGPSHIDLFDFKPAMRALHGQELPPSVRGDQRVTGMTSGQKSFAFAAPQWPMRRAGERGTWISDLLPYTQRIADRITVCRAVHTEAINHDPAVTLINTGSQQMGHASMGSWLAYGLGRENEDLPAYVVLLSQGTGKNPGQPLFSRLWGSGYLPSSHQGVMLRPGANPILYLENPPGTSREERRRLLDHLARLNRIHADDCGDPETLARIDAYELAFRMQASVPDLTDLSDEPDAVFDRYGPESKKPGSFAANCLLARRLAERGVRFVQLFHRGWDQHNNLGAALPAQCRDVDQASAALIEDLAQRGLLDDTLVIWGGEFGRTAYSQGTLGTRTAGRDHHGRCFSMWLAGGGIKAGHDHGETDDFAYNIASGRMHVRDLNATMLHCLGIDHERFTFRHLGLDQRLTGVEPARVVREILA